MVKFVVTRLITVNVAMENINKNKQIINTQENHICNAVIIRIKTER